MKLNKEKIIALLNHAKPLAGLHLNEDAARLLLFEYDKREQPAISKAFSENLPEGCIRSGKLENPKALTETLAKIKARTGKKTSGLIVSLPSELAYLKLYGFPANLDGNKIQESIRLIADFQLPLRPNEAYLDWQTNLKDKNKTALLAALPITDATAYIQAIEAAGFQIIALEVEPLSLLRAAELEEDKNYLLYETGPKDTLVCISKGRSLRYVRTYPKSHLPPEETEQELARLEKFYESQQEKIDLRAKISELAPLREIAEAGKYANLDSQWLPALGAALRGLLPREQDKLISLLPIGTESLYQYDKASSFSKLALTLAVSVCLFYLLAFGGAWGLMYSLQQKSLTRVQDLQLRPSNTPGGLVEKAGKINRLSRAVIHMKSRDAELNPLFSLLKNLAPEGITYTSFSFTSPAEPFTLNGTATTRATLNAFKKNLEEEKRLANIRLPSANLELKANIPFTASLSLSEPYITSEDLK